MLKNQITKDGDNNMLQMTLIRIAYHSQGTFGVLLDEGIPFALTVEREWENNRRNISCIPTGTYICRRVDSPKFGDTFEITNVPNRKHVLFHKGNIEDDSHGCVIIGEQYESYKNKIAILASRKGFSEFLSRTNGINVFTLTIRDA